jgi:hypothetical protein
MKNFVTCTLKTRYYQRDQIKENEVDRACSMHGRDEEHIENHGRKIWSEKPLGRPRHRWEDNIKVDLR